MPVVVDGGKPDFNETLLNFGVVVDPMESISIYGTYSEGFGMPDVGRVLRGISVPGTTVDTTLNLAPLVTDNLEIGVEFEPGWGSIKLAWYESSSDFGARLVPDADGIFSVNREETVVTGWEVSLAAQPVDWFDFSATYSNLTGEFDSDDDGSVDSDLGATSVGPDRLNIYLNFNPAGRWSGRIQSFTYFDKTFRDANGGTTAKFDGYTVVDMLAAVTFGSVRLNFGIANILDETYLTYYSQAGTAAADRYFAGRGRTLNVSANFSF
jgi:iron complex outermembrane receptor protein